MQSPSTKALPSQSRAHVKATTNGQPVVIVTGASQGIGAALVSAYANAGYKVVANSRSIEVSSDANVLNVPGDIGDPQTTARIMSQVDKLGRLDTLINNAGIFIAKPFTEYTFDEYEAITAVNLTGFFRIT